MGSFARLRFQLRSLYSCRYCSSLSSGEAYYLTSKQKSRATLSLIKSESNPDRILEICRAAALTPQIHLDRISFSVAINKLTEAQYFDSIIKYLGELKSRPDLRNERCFSHLIVLYGQAGMLDHAIRTFKEMSNLGIERTARSLNKLLFACVLGKKLDEVYRIFREFPERYAITPDLETYDIVIRSLCESDKSTIAYSLLKGMSKTYKPRADTYNLLIAGFYKEQKYEEVTRVLDLMAKNDCYPGLNTYSVRIQSLCKLKKSDEAKALFDGILSRGVKPNSDLYHHLVYGYCKEGRLEMAKKIFGEMQEKRCDPDSNCYYTLIYYLCEAGDYDYALKLCRDSMEKNWIPCFTTMKALVDGLVRNSKVKEAREMVSKMKKRFSGTSEMWQQIEESLPQ